MMQLFTSDRVSLAAVAPPLDRKRDFPQSQQQKKLIVQPWPCPTRSYACAAATAAPAPAETATPPQHSERHSGSSEPTVLLVDHGSRKASSNDMLGTFAELYR